MKLGTSDQNVGVQGRWNWHIPAVSGCFRISVLPKLTVFISSLYFRTEFRPCLICQRSEDRGGGGVCVWSLSFLCTVWFGYCGFFTQKFLCSYGGNGECWSPWFFLLISCSIIHLQYQSEESDRICAESDCCGKLCGSHACLVPRECFNFFGTW